MKVSFAANEGKGLISYLRYADDLLVGVRRGTDIKLVKDFKHTFSTALAEIKLETTMEEVQLGVSKPCSVISLGFLVLLKKDGSLLIKASPTRLKKKLRQKVLPLLEGQYPIGRTFLKKLRNKTLSKKASK